MINESTLKRLMAAGLALTMTLALTVGTSFAQEDNFRTELFQQLNGFAAEEADEDPVEEWDVQPLPQQEVDAVLKEAFSAPSKETLNRLAAAVRSGDHLVNAAKDGDAALLFGFGNSDPVSMSRRYNQNQALEFSYTQDCRLSLDGTEVERNKLQGNLLEAVRSTNLSQEDWGDLYKDISASLVSVQVRAVSGKRWVNGNKRSLPDDDRQYAESVTGQWDHRMVEANGQIYTTDEAAHGVESGQLNFLPSPFAVVPDKEVKSGETWQSRTLNGRDHQFLNGCRVQYTYKGTKRRLAGFFSWLFGGGNKAHYVLGRIVDPSGEEVGKTYSYIDIVSGQLIEEYVKIDRRDFDLNGKKARAQIKTHVKFLKVLRPGEDQALVPVKK